MVINYTRNVKYYLKHIKKYYMVTNKTSLINLGIQPTEKIAFSHIWDLLYKDDQDQVYNVAGINIKD